LIKETNEQHKQTLKGKSKQALSPEEIMNETK
jgi:hypothetical protein